MTRINTNVSSLTAQTRLTRTNNDLNTALTRLSTGLRINSGKDDPAGLIASESLRSDITSINKALSNTQRASQIIATADSALGQVSSLLNDIRGLVTEAANSGALSDDEIAANQLQVDSSLEAINRIAQTTTFQGRKLLDGSLDFVTKAGTGFSTTTDLQINQANLGATGSVAVSVSISSAATQASITTDGIPASSTPAAKSTVELDFGTAGAATQGTVEVALANSYTVGAEATANIELNSAFTPNVAASKTGFTLGSGLKFDITADNAGPAAGTEGNNTIIQVTTNSTGTTAKYDAESNILTLDLKIGDNVEATIAAALDTALDGKFNVAVGGGAGTVVAGDAGAFTGQLTLGSQTASSGTVFKLSAVNGGAADGAKGSATTVVFTTTTGTQDAVYDEANDQITVSVQEGDTISSIANLINTKLSGTFIATDVANGTYKYGIGNNGTNAATFSAITDTTTASKFQLKAISGSVLDGTVINSTKLVFTAGSTSSSSALYDATSNELRVTVGKNNTVDQVLAAITSDEGGKFEVVSGQTIAGDALFSVDDATDDFGTKTPTAVTAGTSYDGKITVEAKVADASFDTTIDIQTDNSLAAGTATAKLVGTAIIVSVSDKGNGKVALSKIAAAINTLDDYTATLDDSAQTGDSDLLVTSETINGSALASLAAQAVTGGNQGGGLTAELAFNLTGFKGTQTLTYDKGASLADIIKGINGVSDATGVVAVDDAGTLKLTSSNYGSKSVVAVETLAGKTGGTFATGLSATRATGTDIVATVNGFAATGDGNTLSISNSTLDLSLTVAAGSTTAVNFDITGGGALFQLGSDVVSNQQARLGIGSLSTAKLGGNAGRLFELGKGREKSLANDITGAADVIDEVINKVTGLRGRLGAFQRTTLESNSVSLNDTLANLNEAQSSIRDADFAKESANLTRAQILVQSGTSVLGIANQSSQSVLSLLR
jgi:flagellin